MAARGITERYTLLVVSSHRGQKALTDSVFSACRNWTVHDFWSSYFAAGQGHSVLCGAHLLRELQALIELGRSWASQLHGLLLELYQLTRQRPPEYSQGWGWRYWYQQLCE